MLTAIFQPNGQLLCSRCLGITETIDTPAHTGPHNARCDRCQAVCVPDRDDVRHTVAIRDRLRDLGIRAELAQTGGMTCNLLIPLTGGHLLALWDSGRWDGLGVYTDDGDTSDPLACLVGTYRNQPIDADLFVTTVRLLTAGQPKE